MFSQRFVFPNTIVCNEFAQRQDFHLWMFYVHPRLHFVRFTLSNKSAKRYLKLVHETVSFPETLSCSFLCQGLFPLVCWQIRLSYSCCCHLPHFTFHWRDVFQYAGCNSYFTDSDLQMGFQTPACAAAGASRRWFPAAGWRGSAAARTTTPRAQVPHSPPSSRPILHHPVSTLHLFTLFRQEIQFLIGLIRLRTCYPRQTTTKCAILSRGHLRFLDKLAV